MQKLICATATIVLSVVGLITQAQSNSQKEALRELQPSPLQGFVELSASRR